MKIKVILLAIVGLFANSGFSQAFLFSYRTDIVWDDLQPNYIQSVTKLYPDHLGVGVNRFSTGGGQPVEQYFYVFDLSRRRLSLKISDSGFGSWWPVPSSSGSFMLLGQHTTTFKHKAKFYLFNARTQSWTEHFEDYYKAWGRRGFEGAYFATSGYYIKAVPSSGMLQLQFYKF
jgi:hypothetical protein